MTTYLETNPESRCHPLLSTSPAADSNGKHGSIVPSRNTEERYGEFPRGSLSRSHAPGGLATKERLLSRDLGEGVLQGDAPAADASLPTLRRGASHSGDSDNRPDATAPAIQTRVLINRCPRPGCNQRLFSERDVEYGFCLYHGTVFLGVAMGFPLGVHRKGGPRWQKSNELTSASGLNRKTRRVTKTNPSASKEGT